jgi:UDP-N-acetylglucosamine enolpyruvyl transferase
VHDWLYELRLFTLEQLSGMKRRAVSATRTASSLLDRRNSAAVLSTAATCARHGAHAAALTADGVSTITPLETAERGYGRLVERLKMLGAKVER